MSKKMKPPYAQYKRTLSREEVVEIAASSKDLTEFDLSRIDLSDLDLSGCDFSHSRLDFGWLKRARFDGATFNQTSLRNTMLGSTSFSMAQARNAIFANSYIQRSNFRSADLSFASFVRSTIVDTPFDFADLYRANLAGVLLKNCSLQETNFKEARAWRMWIVDSNLKSASFRSAILRGTAFDRCDLTDCEWTRSDLRRIQIANSDYDPVALNQASLKGASIMRSGIQLSVFISYASEDRSFAVRLAEDLRASGVDVWLDAWEIKVGDSLSEQIDKAITDNRYMIVVLSNNFYKKAWAMRELRAAMSKQSADMGSFILPAKIDDASLPNLISDLVYADFQMGYDVALGQLLKGLIEEF